MAAGLPHKLLMQMLLCKKFDELMELFIYYNTTALHSSAAVERLFSFEKDIIKPKRCGVAVVIYFQMLAFLEGN